MGTSGAWADTRPMCPKAIKYSATMIARRDVVRISVVLTALFLIGARFSCRVL